MTHEAIKAAEVERIAKLARLKLTDAEKAQTAIDFDRILDHVDALQQVDTSGIEPTQHIEGIALVLREDRVQPSLPVDVALLNAPERLGDGFGVPKIIE